MPDSLTIHRRVHFHRQSRGRKQLQAGSAPTVQPARVPRITRLMALALKLDGVVRCREVANYAELARLGHVTRARMTQIMNLVLLAPDLQEELLFLPRIESGKDSIHLRHLQPIAQELDWHAQRQLWKKLPLSAEGSR